MKVDLNRLRGVRDPRVIDSEVADIIEKSEIANDPIYLSDLLIAEKHRNYAMAPLLVELRKDPTKMYKLLCIEGKFREQIYPGDVITREHKKSLFREPGVPIPGSEIDTAVQLNQWEKRFTRQEKFTVDAKGCIEVNADDAWYFLTQFGIHGQSGAPISMHPNEFSADPAKNPATGKMGIIRYWRFKELEAAEYRAAPKIERRPKKEPDVPQGDQKQAPGAQPGKE